MNRLLLAAAPIAALLAVPISAGASSPPTPYIWGSFSEFGPAVGPDHTSPTPVSIPGTVTQVVAMSTDTYFLTSTGALYALGAGQRGELGDGSTADDFTTPHKVQFPAGTAIASLASPGPAQTMMATDTTGHAWGWGIDGSGQLCLGVAAEELVPVELPFTNVTDISGAGGHAAYVAGGNLYDCGNNAQGQIGNGTVANVSYLKPQLVNLAHVTEAFTAYGTTQATTAKGDFYSWGLDTLGQDGNGSTQTVTTPEKVKLHSPVVAAFEGGNTKADGQTLVVLANGLVKAWGSNQDGQLCTGRSGRPVLKPVRIGAVPDVVNVASGGNTSYLLDGSGALWACGHNDIGQTGDGTSGADVLTPEKVMTGVKEISATSRNVAALAGP